MLLTSKPQALWLDLWKGIFHTHPILWTSRIVTYVGLKVHENLKFSQFINLRMLVLNAMQIQGNGYL